MSDAPCRGLIRTRLGHQANPTRLVRLARSQACIDRIEAEFPAQVGEAFGVHCCMDPEAGCACGEVGPGEIAAFPDARLRPGRDFDQPTLHQVGITLGIFGCPAFGPARQVRSKIPSAGAGNEPTCLQTSRRMKSRSTALNEAVGSVIRSTRTVGRDIHLPFGKS